MIEHLLHQIWIGPNPIPAREEEWCEKMAAMNPGWSHRLHGNELLQRYAKDPYVRAIQEKQDPLAYLADRLRVLLLRDEGGVYVDADALPLRPLDSLPIWDRPELDFVAGLRSTQRKDVALHRAIPICDNTFLASAKNGRLISRLDSLWTPASITGENCAINGYRVGIAILENLDYNTVLLNHRFIYCEREFPESLILHDTVNLASWVPEHARKPRTCPV